MEYTPKENDLEFAKVSLTNTKDPDFKSAIGFNGKITFEKSTVLIVRRKDGSEDILTDNNERNSAKYSIQPAGKSGLWKLTLIGSYPAARLWIHNSDGNGIDYKVPELSEIKENRTYWLTNPNITLTADRFFDAVYELKKQ